MSALNSQNMPTSDGDPEDTHPQVTTFSGLASFTGKVVLVTGGAGFIGSHVSELLLSRGDRVLLVDEVNDYYDVRIKRSNLAMLRGTFPADRLSIFEGDICDEQFISAIFEQHKPQWVVHLAARAGVRPSIQDPFI